MYTVNNTEWETAW